LTVINQAKLILAFKLCPDDRACHFHSVLESILDRQINNGVRLAAAAYVDNMGKFQQGSVLAPGLSL
jgi:hypothetical protein